MIPRGGGCASQVRREVNNDMKTKLILAGLLVLGFAMPTAVAHHDADGDQTATTPEVDGSTYYVDANSGAIYEETNGHDNLQLEETVYDATNGECELASDTHVENDPNTDADDECKVAPDEEVAGVPTII